MGELRCSADCLQRTGMKAVSVRVTAALKRPGRLGKVWLPEAPGGVARRRRSPSHRPALKRSLDSHTQRQEERACQSMHTRPSHARPGRRDPACVPGSGGPWPPGRDARARWEGQGRPAAPPPPPPPPAPCAPRPMRPPQEAGRTRVPSAAPPQPSRGGPWSTSSSSTPLCASASSSCRLL